MRLLRSIAGTHKVALQVREALLLRLRSYAESITACESSLSNTPDNPDLLYGRGLVRRAIGDEQGAQQDIAAAILRSKNIVAAFHGFGM